jgi:hypothetical protein
MKSYTYSFELDSMLFSGAVFAQHEDQAEDYLNALLFGAVYVEKDITLRGFLPDYVNEVHGGIRTINAIRMSQND